MNKTTCSYCGSSVSSGLDEGGKVYCGFCQMKVEPSVDGKRIERYEKTEFISYDHIRMNTPQLLQQQTKTLLHLLKFMREERRSYFDTMHVLKKSLQEFPDNKDYKEAEQIASSDYVMITRKCYVVETILKDRMGYIPKAITENMLSNFEIRCQDSRNEKSMIIKKPEIPKERNNELNKFEGISR